MSPFEVVNDNHRTAMVRERRREPRRRVLLTGKIVCPYNNLTADCAIGDLSGGGVRVKLEPSLICDTPFLIAVRKGVIYACETALTGENQVGLKLLSQQSLEGEVPLHLRHIRRLWVELIPR